MSREKNKFGTKPKSKFNQSAPELGDDLDDGSFDDPVGGMSLGYNFNPGFQSRQKKRQGLPVSHASFDQKAKGKEFRMYVNDKNYKEMYKCLGKEPTLVDSRSHYTQDTSLHIAARNGDLKTLSLLLEYHPDIKAVNKQGETAYGILAKYISEKENVASPQKQLKSNAENTLLGDFDFDDVTFDTSMSHEEKNLDAEQLEELNEMLEKLRVVENTSDIKPPESAESYSPRM